MLLTDDIAVCDVIDDHLTNVNDVRGVEFFIDIVVVVFNVSRLALQVEQLGSNFRVLVSLARLKFEGSAIC
jgi:hypothetical protein